MPTTTFDFGYIELAKDNGEESFDWYGGQLNAQRVFWGPWEHRLDFIAQYLTYSVNAQGQVVVSPSSFYPDIPTLTPISASIKGKLAASNNGAFGMISYEKALITVKYGIPPFNSNGGITQQNPNGDEFQSFLVEDGSTSTEVVILKGPFLDPVDSLVIPGLDEIQIPISKEDITITQLFNTSPNWSLYGGLLGHINDSNFYLPSGLFATDAKVLYQGYAYHKKFLTDGTPAWEITHKFSLRDQPRWDQKIIKDSVTGWPTYQLLATDPGVFYSGNLNQILIT